MDENKDIAKTFYFDALNATERAAIDLHLARHVNHAKANLPKQQNEWREIYAQVIKIDPMMRVHLLDRHQKHEIDGGFRSPL